MKLLSSLIVVLLLGNAAAFSQTVTGTGTLNYVPKFTGTSIVGNSTIYDNGTNVGVGTTTPAYKFDVNGNIRATSSANMDISAFGSGSTVYFRSSYYNRTNNFGVLPTVNDAANGASLGYVDNFTAGWTAYANVNRSTGIAPGTYDVFVRIRTNGAGNAPTTCTFGIYDGTALTYPILTTLTSLSTSYQEVYGGKYVLTAAMLANNLITFFSSAGVTTNYYLDYVKLVPSPIFVGSTPFFSGIVGIGAQTPRQMLDIETLIPKIALSSITPAANTTDNMVLSGIEFYKHYGVNNAGAIRLLHSGGTGNYVQAHMAFYTDGPTPVERMRIASGGNVLIGATIDNGYKLDVNGSARVNGSYNLTGTQQAPNYIYANGGGDNSKLLIQAGSSAGVYSQIEVTGNWDGTGTIGGKVAMSTAGIERLRINAAGNLLIGTTADNTIDKLQVNGSLSALKIKYAGSVLSANANNLWIGQTNLGTEDPLTNSSYFFGINPRMGAERVLVVEARTADGAGAIVFKSGNSATGATITGAPERMRLSTYGNLLLGTATDNATDKLQVNGSGSIVGNLYCNSKLYIGTPDANTTTRIANYALAVNGNAIFNKAKVMLYGTPWADYVFEEKYGLLPLEDLEKFIKLNKHLPEVPTAPEVEKDGIDLGSNQTLLLKKIEELTLYVIEQNKTTQLLQAQVNTLSQELEAVKKEAKIK